MMCYCHFISLAGVGAPPLWGRLPLGQPYTTRRRPGKRLPKDAVSGYTGVMANPKRKPYTVDAIDQGVARLEDHRGGTSTGPATALPRGAREGSALSRGKAGDLRLDKPRRQGAQARRDALPQAPSGDLDLSTPGTLRGSALGTLRRAATALRGRLKR